MQVKEVKDETKNKISEIDKEITKVVNFEDSIKNLKNFTENKIENLENELKDVKSKADWLIQDNNYNRAMELIESSEKIYNENKDFAFNRYLSALTILLKSNIKDVYIFIYEFLDKFKDIKLISKRNREMINYAIKNTELKDISISHLENYINDLIH